MSQVQFDNLETSAARAINHEAHQNDYLAYVQNKEQALSMTPFITGNEKMLRIKEIINQIADANVPVLITGESGTGKELVARSIHSGSKRQEQNFVAINCAALPSSLLESELFGFEKGSFTGAHQRHIGKFEQATGGTLLLDEVTEIDPPLQAKLLRVLQEKEIERLGGSGPIKVDTRIIATSNRNIQQSVNEGTFRQDLYYRLYVIHLEIPPLREREGDVELLSTHFAKEFGLRFGRFDVRLTTSALIKLQHHRWPGNIRELQNVMQRAVLMASGSLIEADDIQIETTRMPSDNDWVKTLPVGRKLQDLETEFILATLKHHRGNRTHAAKTLGISLRTLRNKINEFSSAGIEVIAPLGGKSL